MFPTTNGCGKGNTSAFWGKMRQNRCRKTKTDAFLKEACPIERPEGKNGHKIGENVAKCAMERKTK